MRPKPSVLFICLAQCGSFNFHGGEFLFDVEGRFCVERMDVPSLGKNGRAVAGNVSVGVDGFMSLALHMSCSVVSVALKLSLQN